MQFIYVFFFVVIAITLVVFAYAMFAVRPTPPPIPVTLHNQSILESINNALGTDREPIDPPVHIELINDGLDCSVLMVNGHCPDGYVARPRACAADGSCCVLASVDGKAIPDYLQDKTGISSSTAATMGTIIIVSGTLSALVDLAAKKALGAQVQVASSAMIASIRSAEKLIVKASMLCSKSVITKASSMLVFLASGPVGVSVALVELSILITDLYDRNGYLQFGSNIAFMISRDYLEFAVIQQLTAMDMQGPPFICPWYSLFEEEKTLEGLEPTPVFILAISQEYSTSIAWLSANKPEVLEELLAKASVGAIDPASACSASNDACSSESESSCGARDECVWMGTGCRSNNLVQAAIDRVPMAIRDQHFFDALCQLSPDKKAYVRVFDRGKHPWYRGACAQIPYAITLTEVGRDAFNSQRENDQSPLAIITDSYRVRGTGTWTSTTDNLNLEGISNIPPAIPGNTSAFASVTVVPKLKTEKISEALCLITMGELLRAICEDDKSGGIESIGETLTSSNGVDVTKPILPRNNLRPTDYGLKYDWAEATCQYTTQFCDRVGLQTFTNELGQLDCKMGSGQGWAELIFGTTLTRDLIRGGKALGDALEAVFDPKSKNSVDIGGVCKVYSECKGHDLSSDQQTNCCVVSKAAGEEARDLWISTSVVSAIMPVVIPAALPIALTKDAMIPRTCQVMQKVESGAKFCPFDAANPTLGTPIPNGQICGPYTTCDRCESKTHEYWTSLAFEACGVEPGWRDGTRCGPGTTCSKCSNGFSQWEDGSTRCGPRVAGTTVQLGGTCGYDNNCVGFTNTTQPIKCCDGTCTNAVFKIGSWYCPNNELIRPRADGELCVLGTTCNNCPGGENSATMWNDALAHCGNEPANVADGVYCDLRTCHTCANTATTWADGITRCGSQKADWIDGKICTGTAQCNLCASKTSSDWPDLSGHKCGTMPTDWPDGKTCISLSTSNTCSACASGKHTRWNSDGRDHCGAAEIGTGESQISGACARDENCAGFDSDAPTKCCNYKCEQAKSSEGAWYCPSEEPVRPRANGEDCVEESTCPNCPGGVYSTWYGSNSEGITRCGIEPKWKDGVKCELGEQCNKVCQNPASMWYAASGAIDHVRCGQQPGLADGAACALGSSCSKCTSSARMWSDALYHCGVEPKNLTNRDECVQAVAPLDAKVPSCMRCPQNYTLWTIDSKMHCGNEPPSYTRAGTAPTCADGQVQRGNDCYQASPAGYDWTTPGGILIGKTCPAGIADTGTTCAYDRGSGRLPSKQPCADGLRDDGTSCWKDSYSNSAGVVPTLNACPSGSKDVGGTCWSDTTCRTVDKGYYNYSWGAIGCEGRPNDQCYRTWISRLETVDCPTVTKNIGDRGTSCGDNKTNIGGLCYDNCRPGYHFEGGLTCAPDGHLGGYIETSLENRQGCSSGEELVNGLCYTRPRDGFGCTVTACSMSKDVKSGTKVSSGNLTWCANGGVLDNGVCYPPPMGGYTCNGPTCLGV